MIDNQIEQKTTLADELVALPDVLIQDPYNDRAFMLRASDLGKYTNTAHSWSSIGPNTVTFVIPDEDGLEEIPPFSQSATESPDVLIQWPKGRMSFHIEYRELENYEIPLEDSKAAGYGISFVIPRGTELIDSLPALRAAILQSGELQFR